jgi:hypothetical protein
MKKNFTKQDFYALLEPNGDCLEWTCGTHRQGYGLTSNPELKKMVTTHRMAYELEFGAIPDEMHVLHKCDNPPCCNPNHLFLGTHQDNMLDMKEKGRRIAAIKTSKKTILTELEVLKIRELYANGECKMTALAKMYNTTYANIWHIIKRDRWKHI